MADIMKHSNDTINFIRHNMRELPHGKSYGNTSVNTKLSKNNYSLIDRGKTADEINNYRKNIENQLYRFKRKNAVKSIEVVIQKPDDCNDEKLFFKECLSYVVSTLPMGEKSVFMAEVHKDEHKIVNGVDISKPHLHIMYVPAVKDNKHKEYDFKLCADQLTKKENFKSFHPGLQKWLDEKGVKGTILNKYKTGKAFKLAVAQLKEFTDSTGVVIDGSKTLDELAELCKQYDFKFNDKDLQRKIENAQNISIIDDTSPALYSVCKKLGVSGSKVKEWLINEGYITKAGEATERGEAVGIYKALNSFGQARLVYDENAQDFIKDNLNQIRFKTFSNVKELMEANNNIDIEDRIN